jgi:2-oxoglutarate dehydrogenase E1 component
VQHDSLLFGDNAAFIDDKYAAWLEDPGAVEPEWAELFASLDEPPVNGGPRPGRGPSFRPRSIFEGQVVVAGDGDASILAESDRNAMAAASKQARVAQLVNAFRVRGHLLARVDPLGERERVEHPELTLAYYGLGDADLDLSFATAPLYGMPEFAALRDILAHCHASYATYLASEYMNINVVEQKQWVAEQIESLPTQEVLNRAEEHHLLRRLSDAENFEHMLHTRFPGTKRFSLEGGETLVPLLDILIENASNAGIEEIVFGMAHRGRLNVLANIMEKPVSLIVQEFEDPVRDDLPDGGGDVKYHLGYSSDRITLTGRQIHLSLTPNPSHLEAVDPVVMGRVRAKQDRADNGVRTKRMGVQIHGDAAFAGQGVVAEVLQASELRGYHVGGTIHVIVNNQIGFTTQPEDARSGPYASDLARLAGIPIFHVNGESPRAVAAAAKIAVKWRQTFQRDVVIDMYCYRKYGHNEGDEPGFTQPKLYKLIRKRPTPRQAYAAWLQKIGYVTAEDVDRIAAESLAAINAELDLPEENPELPSDVREGAGKGADPDLAAYSRKPRSTGVHGTKDGTQISPFKGLWGHYVGSIHDETDTTAPKEHLQELLRKANTVPKGFKAHRKVTRLFEQRLEMIDGTRPIDWAVGEQLAFATLLVDGHGVRMSGQDCGRGTFSHRHAVLTDLDTAVEHRPLAHLTEDQADFQIWDSFLSEYAVLGFEFGYSIDEPKGLVLWEAQFGDFANGAQIMIDQFITSSEQKWGRCSGLVMLLPHGYEGQGPEHSSARLERFLQSCAEENIQVANITTPANYFHALRRQVLRNVRKPLVVMSPKSLLRSPLAVSTLDELAGGAFQHVIADPDEPTDARRVVLCSGKVYYELAAARQEARAAYEVPVALHRVEMLYPFPHLAIGELLDRHPAAEVVWCQEEPRNMGAWPSLFHWFHEHFPGRAIRYVGRPASSSPAGGSHKGDRSAQRRLVREAVEI